MGVGRVNQLALLEEVEQFADLESNVLSDAVGRELTLREVLEDSAQWAFKLLKDRL